MDYKELIERTKCPNSVRECKWLGLYDFSCKRCREQTMKDCAAAIETLLAEREAAGWISVDDKLPEPHKTVFAHRENGSIELMHLVRYGKWSIPESKYLPRVTHWMPLPAPPDRQQTKI